MKILSNLLVKAGVIVDNQVAVGTSSPFAGYTIDARGSNNFGDFSFERYHYFNSSNVSGGSALTVAAANLSANSARSHIMLTDTSSSVLSRFGLGVYTGTEMYAYLDSASKLVINNASGANVIIGNTVDSGQKLQVYGSTLVAGDLTVTNANNATINLGLIQKITVDSGTGVFKFWNGSGGGWSFDWYNNGVVAMTLNTANQLVLTNLAGTGTRMVVASSTGVLSTQTIPGGTVTSIALATGSTGTDVNVTGSPITSSGTITLNIPNASTTARGVVTTEAQTFGGDKTFYSAATILDTSGSSSHLQGKAGGTLYGGIYFGPFYQFNAYSPAVGGYLWKNGVGDNVMELAQSGVFTLKNLSGSGSRMVVADANGVLSTQAVPSGTISGTGTTNYVSKFLSASVLGDSQIFDNGTNVGIGTASPSRKLTVAGGFQNTDSVALASNGGNVAIGHSTPSGIGGPIVHIHAVSIPEIRLTNNSTGSGFEDGFNIYVTGSSVILNNYEAGSIILRTSNTTRLTISNSGIVTANSLAGTGTRMVVADATGALSTQNVPSGTLTGTGTINYISKWTSTSALGDSLIFDNGTNVGISTATPAAKLHVEGALRITTFEDQVFTYAGTVPLTYTTGIAVNSGVVTKDGTSATFVMANNIVSQMKHTGVGANYVANYALGTTSETGGTTTGALIYGAGAFVQARRRYSDDLSTNASNGFYGIVGSVIIEPPAPASIVTGTVYGGDFGTTVNTGSVTTLAGLNSLLRIGHVNTANATTVTDAYGVRLTSTIGSATGGATTISNFYGLFVANPTVNATGTIINRWAIYSADSAISYINGSVLIGTTSNSGHKLDVAGVVHSNTSFNINSYGTISWDSTGNGRVRVRALANRELSFGANNLTENMIIDLQGNVGINTTSLNTGVRLTVSGAIVNPTTSGNAQTATLRLQQVSGSNGVMDFGINSSLHGWIQVSNRTALEAPYNLLLNPNGGSVGVGTLTVNTSALLEMSSTSKGFLPPRMTAAQRGAISSPATGLVVYQTDGNEGLWLYTVANGWRALAIVV